MTIAAKFEDGVFKPLEKVSLAEGTVVELQLPGESAPERSPEVRNSPIVGLWKDRTDITDSDEYIYRLRRDLHGE